MKPPKNTLETLKKRGFVYQGVEVNEWIHPDKPGCHLEYDQFSSWTAWKRCPTCGHCSGLCEYGGATSRKRLQDVLRDFWSL